MITLKPWKEIEMIPHIVVFEVWVGTIYDNMIIFNPQAQNWTERSTNAQTYLRPLFGQQHNFIYHNGQKVIEILPNNGFQYHFKVEDYMLKEPSTGGTPEVPYPEGRPAGTGGSYRLRL